MTDVKGRQQRIAKSIVWTIPGTLAALILLDLFVVPAPVLEGRGDRIGYALRCCVFAMLPYFLVCMRIAANRFFEGSHNPLEMTASPSLAIDCRVMQNHLEQLVLFVIAALALATTLPAEHLQVLAIATGLFMIARGIYWWGYHQDGTLGRAPGVQMSFTINITMVLGAVGLIVARWFGA